MALAAAAQLNNLFAVPEEEEEVIPTFKGKCLFIFEDLYKDLSTHSAIALGGDIFTYSGREKANGQISTCTRTLEEFADRLARSVSTIRRNISKLKDYIKKVGQSSYIFMREGLTGELYLRLPLCILDFEFTFKDGSRRKLTPSEWLVFALLFTRCDNKKKSDRSYEGSNRQICNELGGNICDKTVNKAINNLISCGLIFCIEKGVNKYRTSTYCVDFTLLRKLEKARRKSREKKPAPPGNFATQAEKARYYSELKAIAEEKAERMQALANCDQQYFNIQQEIEATKAEMFDPRNVRQIDVLAEELDKLNELADERLKVLKIDKRALNADYYCQCKKCNDTGYRPDGTSCDCYKR